MLSFKARDACYTTRKDFRGNFLLMLRKEKMRVLDGGKMERDSLFTTMINFTTKRFNYTIQAGRSKNLPNILTNIFLHGLKMKNLMSLTIIKNSIEDSIRSVSNLALIAKEDKNLEQVIEGKN